MALKDELITMAMNDSKRFHSLSMDDTLEDTVNKILTTGQDSVAIKDHYRNTLTATGTADKVESFTSYGFNNDTLNWPLWLALYNDSWVFRRAIDKPAQDEVNCGFTLHGEQDFTRIYKAYGRYKTDLIRLLMWGALFGGSVAVMMFDNITDEEMAQPIRIKKIKNSRMRLYVTDRWYGVSITGTETVTDMRDIDFGKPKMYNITFADGKMMQVHHSYVLRYEHRTAPQLIKQGQLQGWGYAEGAHILNELSRDDQLKSSITSLVNKSLIEVIKMAGMRGVFMGTDKGNEDQLRKRLEMVNWGRSYNSLTFLDKDDDYQQWNLQSLPGLADLMEKNMWLISAALEMQGILYGDLKGGLSQETDALRRYAITIENRCNAYYRPVLHKLLMVLFGIYGIEGPVDFDFNSLVVQEENSERMEAINTYQNVLGGLIDKGIISKYQAALSIQNLMSKDIIDIQFTEENLNRLKLEEEYQILETIKNCGKTRTTGSEIVSSQFGADLPDKLSYLNPDESDETAEAEHASAPVEKTEETKETERVEEVSKNENE